MIRLWRHLRLLKQGSRAHDSTGVKGTTPGELALLCPACPHPGINLPPSWDSVPDDHAYVATLVIVHDVYVFPVTFTIRVLVSTPASASNDEKSLATKRTLS